MLTAYYVHRLPADYDTGIIHRRARERGKLWDATPDLYFKGFLLREAGRHGATENNYASFYLWRHDQAFRDFLTQGHYRNVTNSFGRAGIQSQVVLDARKGGAAAQARFALLDEFDIPADADLDEALRRETARNRDEAARPGTVAAAVSLDTQRWRFTRIRLSEGEPDAPAGGTLYQILHLAQPLLHTLAPSLE